MRILHLVTLGLVVAAAQGCTTAGGLAAPGLGGGGVEEAASAQNEAHARASTAIVAVNVLRARDGWPTDYAAVAAAPPRSPAAPAVETSAAGGHAGAAPPAFRSLRPDVLRTYWDAGWSRPLLMWLFVESVTFPGDAGGFVDQKPVRLDAEKLKGDAGADAELVGRYRRIAALAEQGDVNLVDLGGDPPASRNCTPYDPVYLRETLGQRTEPLAATVATIEALSGEQLVLTPDPKDYPQDQYIAPDKFKRRLMLCDNTPNRWGFVDRRTGRPLASVRLRSPDGAIRFLGDALRLGSDGEGAPVVLAEGKGPVALFRASRRLDPREYALKVDHGGDSYYVAPHAAPGDATGATLSLLIQALTQ